MRISRTVFLAASLFAMGCSSDDSTGPNGTQIESRLSASVAAPTASMSARILSMNVAVTNSLVESVSGDACANTVEARVGSGDWTNVTSTTFACSSLGVTIAAGGTSSIVGVADTDKVRTLLGGATGTVRFRVQHTMTGASRVYTLQSNEVSWTAN